MITEILRAALEAVDPAHAVAQHLHPEDFAFAERVFIVGAGKAGNKMAQAAAKIIGAKLMGGIVVVPQMESAPEGMTYIRGGHPLPDDGSLAGGLQIANLLKTVTAHYLVIALISGGGSALLELPKPGLTLADLRATNHALLRCGASIHEINQVRIALSQIKGGGLAQMAHPARVLSLILSDVIGNPLELIASGPTVITEHDPTAPLAIVEKYQLHSTLPSTVLSVLADSSVVGRQSSVVQVENRLIASNRLAGEAAVQTAQTVGFTARYLTDNWRGEARDAGTRFAELVLQLNAGEMIVVGGETTVTLHGHGKGGRNQEAALAAAMKLDGHSNVHIACVGTDGIDGPTDAAGARVSGETLQRARALGLDAVTYLAENNAYPFFAALGDLIMLGPTGTNVNDLWFGWKDDGLPTDDRK